MGLLQKNYFNIRKFCYFQLSNVTDCVHESAIFIGGCVIATFFIIVAFLTLKHVSSNVILLSICYK